MLHNIKISKIEKSRIHSLDFNNIPLGRTFTDHMFICEYESPISIRILKLIESFQSHHKNFVNNLIPSYILFLYA